MAFLSKNRLHNYIFRALILLLIFSNSSCTLEAKKIPSGTPATRTIPEENDIPIHGDYDGDGKSDLVFYRPRNSGFYGRLSIKGKKLESHFGVTGDIPVSGDFDGDGKSDIAVYRMQSGVWSYKSSKDDLTYHKKFGGVGFFPFPKDFNQDGKCDLGIRDFKDNKVQTLDLKTNKTKAYGIESIKDLKNNDITEIYREKYSSNLYKSGFANLNLIKKHILENKEELITKGIKQDFGKNIEGISFAFDLDLDFADDLIIYNEDSMIFSIFQSTSGYKLEEING